MTFIAWTVVHFVHQFLLFIRDVFFQDLMKISCTCDVRSVETTDCLTEGSLSNTLNEKNSLARAHNTRGRHSSVTMDTVRNGTRRASLKQYTCRPKEGKCTLCNQKNNKLTFLLVLYFTIQQDRKSDNSALYY